MSAPGAPDRRVKIFTRPGNRFARGCVSATSGARPQRAEGIPVTPARDITRLIEMRHSPFEKDGSIIPPARKLAALLGFALLVKTL